MAREKHLEELLFSHPYLIDEEFAGLVPQRQVRKGRNRLDLLFDLGGQEGVCIVELKKAALTIGGLRQLLNYCRGWGDNGGTTLASHHYLIGKRPPDDRLLRQEAAESGFDIRIRYIGEHIPLQLAWDAAARRYRSIDEGCEAMGYFELKI